MERADDRDVSVRRQRGRPVTELRPRLDAVVPACRFVAEVPEGDDDAQDHRDEIPEAHEAAAEAVRVGDVELTTEEPGQRPRNKALKTRRDMAKPTAAAPGPVNVDRAKAGVVKGKARRGAESGVADAPDTAGPKVPVVKMSKGGRPAGPTGGAKKATKAAPPKAAAAAKGKPKPAAKKAAPKAAPKAAAKAAPKAAAGKAKKAPPKKAAAKGGKAPAKKGGAKKGR